MGVTMKSEKLKKMVGCIVVAVVLMIFVGITVWSNNKKDIAAIPSVGERVYEESYQAYLEEHGYSGELQEQEIQVDLEKYTADQGMVATIGQEGILTEDEGRISWEFKVDQPGFYQLELGYIALPGTTSDIQRKIYIDGEIPYNALSQIVIKRWWQDDEINVKNENEIRPEAYEIYSNVNWFVEDYQRRNNEPLMFYFDKGVHTIGFEVIKEPLEFTSLTFKSAQEPQSYEEAIQTLKDTYQSYDGESLICQAERKEGGTTGIIKSSSSINIQKNYSDSELIPYHPYHIVYNTIGAKNWAQPGDSITWEVEVPEEGLYELTFKGRQNVNRGVTSYRRLYVNGTVPYKEMEAVGFDYQGGMNNYTISDENQEPLLFHLTKGKNTITLENVMGPLGGIISRVEESMKVLNKTYLSVIQLTGQAPEKFIDYEINKKIPEFKINLEQESANLYEAIDAIVAITGEKGENTSLLEKMAMQAKWLSDDPESVIEELSQLKNNISALGTWLVNISSMPLEVDYVALSGDSQNLPKARESYFAGVKNGTIRFFSTFFVKNSQISQESSAEEGKTIKVWMASFGREQAQMIQNMIDESFTPESDISVNLQLIPVDVVLRAALAGNGPDVVIGLNQATLQDFAMRNAVEDLSKMEGYTEVSERFYESTIDAARYQDGIYGMPEQATFMMMFARNDILAELGVERPETWTEFLEVIPVLQKNNYNVYIPNLQQTEATVNATAITYNMNLYLSLVKQNGGEVYLGEGNEYGIRSGLAEDNAISAFKSYTDFFTGYGLDVQVDFTNRFRAGEIPLGITNYTTFCQLEIFAPEIKGLWSFYPIPGIQKEDGTIDKSFVVDTVQSVMMSKSSKKEQAWEFIKWWTGTKAQLTFANSLEALMGTSARYAAADKEVLKQLPWSNAELESLLEQYEATVGIQAVPGNYMTTRMVQYSFNDVVSENANPRESLYLKVKDIDQELTRKREELKLKINGQEGGNESEK